MKRMNLLFLMLALLLLSISASLAQIVAVPNSMNFQGRLAKPDGTPVADGEYIVRFRLYDAPTGGSVKFDHTFNPLVVKNGTFAVTLSGFVTGTFSGNLFLGIKIGTDAELTPRQPVTSVAYAFKADTALSVPDGSITGAKLAPATITADKFAANLFNPLVWLLNGNSGVTSGFLGTTDNNPLEFRVNGRRAMRYRYAEDTQSPGNEFRSINVLGGSDINVIDFGAVGATIAGGGLGYISQAGSPNRVHTYFGTVGGGYGNIAEGNSATVGGGGLNVARGEFATIGGGYFNFTNGNNTTVAGGGSNAAIVANATVAGGTLNEATHIEATVGGGRGNLASGEKATVGGGHNNTASGYAATVAGGEFNTAAGAYSFAAGREALANHAGTFVWGDSTNTVFTSSGVNQFLIRASGGVGINTNAPNGVLHIKGTGVNAQAKFGGTGGDAHHLSSARDFVFNAATGQFSFRSTTFDNLASYTDQFTIFPNGNATLRGTLTQSSDARWKQNIASFPNALDAILNLRGVTYEWNPTAGMNVAGGRQIGFIAQEVEKVLPELVSTDANGYKSVAYSNVVPVLVEAVKTLKAQNDSEVKALKMENTQLKAKLDAVLERLERLEADRK